MSSPVGFLSSGALSTSSICNCSSLSPTSTSLSMVGCIIRNGTAVQLLSWWWASDCHAFIVFSPTVALLWNSCGLFVATGRCDWKKDKQRLHKYCKTQLLLEVQRAELFSKSTQLQEKKVFFFSQPDYIMSFHPHLRPAGWSLSSYSFPFTPDPAAGPRWCLAAASVQVTATVLQRLSRWTPRNPQSLLV